MSTDFGFSQVKKHENVIYLILFIDLCQRILSLLLTVTFHTPSGEIIPKGNEQKAVIDERDLT